MEIIPVHKPILVNKIISFLDDNSNDYIVDCTLGEGGHSEALLNAYPNIKIIGIERNQEIYNIALERLKPFSDRIELINTNFSNIHNVIDESKKDNIGGFLFDFGISLYHYKSSSKGFSLFSYDKLDMRLDNSCPISAYEVVNGLTEEELVKIIRDYGEEKWAKVIVKHILSNREIKPIYSCNDLKELVNRAIPSKYHSDHIDASTKTFQALRIYVNNELKYIEDGLKVALELLKIGGKIITLSYHSLEDRLVKTFFKDQTSKCICPPLQPVCNCSPNPKLKILTHKPITPIINEISDNPAARSAKLRVATKISN